MICFEHASYLLFPQQLTVRHIHKTVHKHLMQTLCHLLLRHAFLQHDLQKATAACTADQPAIDQLFNAAEDLTSVSSSQNSPSGFSR